MKLLSKFLPILALLLSGTLQAQLPFWTETFSSGIPAGWTNVDASGQGFTWQWCASPDPTCAPIFSGQQPFAAATAATGFVHVDSDAGLQAPLPQSHVSRLTTSAIDCTGKPQVWVQCQSHIGNFYGPASTRAILRVSTNLTDWTNFTIFPDLTTTNQDFFSVNPYISVVNISSVAANQGTVYLQWQWTANWEYMWDLDDVKLFEQEPLVANDLVIGDFFYAPSSLAQPVSQIATDTFSFGANISNEGPLDQSNVVLRAAVLTNTNVELWADSILLPSLASGVVDSFVELPNRYAPELPVGTYRIQYSVRASAADDVPGDNTASSPFYVTANIFSKEAQVQTAIRPQNLGNGWFVGNLYHMSAGSLDNYQATTAFFTFDADDPEIPVKDVDATVYLFRVNDGVDFSVLGGFDRSTFFSPDLTWKGVAFYSAPDTMVGGLMQAVDLLDLDAQTVGVNLDKGARYLVVVGYADQNKFAYHAFNQDVKMFFASTFTFSDVWYTNGFGVEDNAVLRMTISLVTTTDNKPLAESSMRIVPNPVRDMLNLAVSFDKPTNATITIADLSGRVIEIEDRESLTTDNLSYPVRQLAPGTYLARIATAEGTLTKKFVKM